MSVSLKCSDLISAYNGDSDFAEWARKLELVAKLQKIGELENFLPLFLSGGAFAVYEALDGKVQGDYKALKQALTQAFSSNPIKAFQEFTHRRLEMGEVVDVYLADLRRLAGLVSSESSVDWVRCAFVNGLPQDVKCQLMATNAVERLSLPELVERVRSVIQTREVPIGALAAMKTTRKGTATEIVCFTCRKKGHVAQHCPQRVGASRCWSCGEPGHFASACPKVVSKNE